MMIMPDIAVLLPSIIFLEDDLNFSGFLLCRVLLPSIILLEDDHEHDDSARYSCFATIYYFARR